MVKAFIQTDCTDLSVTVLMTGHADYAKKGKDIVCAAVSMLFATTVQNISVLMQNGTVKAECDEINDGDNKGFVLRAKDEESMFYITMVASFLLTGMKLLEENYKDNVQVTYVDIDKAEDVTE